MSAQSHYCHPGERGEFIFGYGELDQAQIATGVDRLAQVLDR
ncbi:hypothetical protein [Stenomitos frigidus]|nr:hypothetical protein [Stenomitos frigidus]